MKHFILGTAGHIDHGKTSLVKMLTDIDCDTHKEEKERGITINLGFSHISLPSGESLGIVDVPGHKDFISTMVGGACGIDVVLLVIAADSGIMPQTIEHINIINALGIKKAVVALNKADLVDDELLEMASYEIAEFLDNTSLKNSPIIPVSSTTKKGKEELIAAIEKTVQQIEEEENTQLFRLYIDRIFTVKGFGSVVTGSVLGGSLEKGNEVFLLPGDKQKLRVRSIERHGEAVDKVVHGDRAAINLIGLKYEQFERGMLISDKQLDTTVMIDAYITAFDPIPSLKIWSSINFISGTYESSARMHLLNKDSLKSGEDAIVQIHLNKEAVLINKDKFIIRNSSDNITLGGGYIIDAAPLHHKKRSKELIDNLTSLCVNILSDDSVNEDISLVLKRDFRPFDVDELAERLSMNKNKLLENISIENADFVCYDNAVCIAKNFDAAFEQKTISLLKEHHAAHPIFDEGLEIGEIIGKLGLSKIKSGKMYLGLLLDKLKKEKILDTYKNTWIITSHKALIDTKTEEEIHWLENEIRNNTENKIVIAELEEKAADKGIHKSNIKTYLSYLANKGKIRFYSGDFVHTEILESFRLKLFQAILDKGRGISIPEFKEIIPLSKRYRALLSDIYEAEKQIQFSKDANGETVINITAKGKEYLNASIS